MFHVKRSNLATYPMFHVKHKKTTVFSRRFVFTKIKYFCPFLKVFGVQGCFFKSTPHYPTRVSLIFDCNVAGIFRGFETALIQK